MNINRLYWFSLAVGILAIVSSSRAQAPASSEKIEMPDKIVHSIPWKTPGSSWSFTTSPGQ